MKCDRSAAVCHEFVSSSKLCDFVVCQSQRQRSEKQDKNYTRPAQKCMAWHGGRVYENPSRMHDHTNDSHSWSCINHHDRPVVTPRNTDETENEVDRMERSHDVTHSTESRDVNNRPEWWDSAHTHCVDLLKYQWQLEKIRDCLLSLRQRTWSERE